MLIRPSLIDRAFTKKSALKIGLSKKTRSSTHHEFEYGNACVISQNVRRAESLFFLPMTDRSAALNDETVRNSII